MQRRLTSSFSWLLGLLCVCTLPVGMSHATDLAQSGNERYQIVSRTLVLTRLGEQAVQALAANAEVAVVQQGQSLSLLRRGTRNLVSLAPLPMHVNPSYGALCRAGDGFVVALNLPASTEQGGSPATQTPARPSGAQGMYHLVDQAGPGPDSGTTLRWLETLRITSRPRSADMPFADQGPASLRGPINDCAWDGRGLYVALAGALGKANLERQTIDLLNVDDPSGTLAQRGPLWVETQGIWVGYDGGSSQGTWLSFHPHRGQARTWPLAWNDDPVALSALTRHQGQLFMGTSHGLFRLDDRSGRWIYQDLGDGMPGAYINGLYSDRQALWVLSGGQWLRLNPASKAATLFVTQPTATLIAAVPFEDYWLVGGPQGLWRTPPVLPAEPKSTKPPSRSTRDLTPTPHR